MIAKKINTNFNLEANHIFYFHQGTWYHNLKKFPGILVDRNGYVRFETEDDYINDSFLQHGTRLHIRDGISSMPNYIEFTEIQKFMVNQFSSEETSTTDQAERIPRNIDTIPRNQSLVRLVKRLRDNTCQICDLKLEISQNVFYSEVHHIRPLGIPHDGPDIISNMICVCPNCHKKLDYGFEVIDYSNIQNLSRHAIGENFVNYHNLRSH